MKLIKSIFLSSLLLASLSTYANTQMIQDNNLDDSVDSVQLTEISPLYADLDTLFPAIDKGGENPAAQVGAAPDAPAAQGGFSVNGAGLEEANKNLGTIVEMTDRLIAIGQKIWKIVDAGRPVSNIDGVIPSVSVLPRGLEETGSLYDMFGWSEPMIKSYNLDYRNRAGAVIATLRFSVMMQHSGTDGKGGVYISGLSIVPNQVKVAWGYDFNAQTKLINITNRGTAQNPIAAATIELAYQVKNATLNENKRIRFFVEGNGKITQLQQ